MGKVTYYCDLKIQDYFSTENLVRRVDLCVTPVGDPVIDKVDWFTWWYLLYELCTKKLAILYGFRLNSKEHNSNAIMNYLLLPKLSNGDVNKYYDELFDKYLRAELGLTTNLLFSEYDALLELDYVSLRYNVSEADKLDSEIISQARLLLEVLVNYLRILRV